MLERPRGTALVAPRSAPARPTEGQERSEHRQGGEGADASGTGNLGPVGAASVLTGVIPAAPPPPPGPAQSAAALQELWPVLVRRVAWEGDRHRGSVRLELGAGELSGATLFLQCESGRVRVALTDPAGADLAAWRARIGARLLAAGLDVDGVE